MLVISTDYVFDGNKKSKYMPLDATNPLNNYGLTKWQAEEAVRTYCKQYYVVRTSWLYGHHGKNFVETMINCAKQGKELKVVNDQIGCPTWTVALSEGIIDLLDEMPELWKEVRIQDDLYNYVNGEWLEKAVIPDDKPSTGGFNVLNDEVEKQMINDLFNLTAFLSTS